MSHTNQKNPSKSVVNRSRALPRVLIRLSRPQTYQTNCLTQPIKKISRIYAPNPTFNGDSKTWHMMVGDNGIVHEENIEILLSLQIWKLFKYLNEII